jgi:hypothetical protein
MGVLDDAIREHLELKRQHGVPEEELQRQEEEALGPARRDVAPAESADDEAAAEPELHDQETMLREPEAEEPASPPTEESPAESAPFDAATELSAPEPEAGGAVSENVAEAHEPEPEPEPAEDRFADEALTEGAAEQASFGGAAEEPSFGSAVEGADEVPFDAPAESDTPDEAPREPAGDTLPSGFEEVDEAELLDDDEIDEENADVLEDTPDFLQETPEHDRLWFEQKPPRDFDFD